MRKILSVLLAAALAAASLAGCGKAPADSSGISVVCTVYPVYDWLGRICGENSDIKLTLIGGNGADMHSYQPTAADISAIAGADLTVYVGGSSDEWVSDAAEKSGKQGAYKVSLFDVLAADLVEEELTEGMESADEHDHDGDDGDGHEYDEHVWLSPKKAITVCSALSDAVAKIDPANAEEYHKNCDRYIEAQLRPLDEDYSQAISSAARDTLVFADRYPFRYLAEDYGLNCFAAFPGCSAETDASFDTVIFLAKKLDELSLDSIIIIDGSDEKLAKTVISNSTRTDCRILTLNSMQAVTAQQISSANGYAGIMRENLEVLKQALS